MAERTINVEQVLMLSNDLVVDVRSPSEYAHAHIPGAINLPLFNDAERAEIGTLYNQKGREQAMLHALNYYSPNMKVIVTQLEVELNNMRKRLGSDPEIIIHCWRGGMRSGVVCWMLELFGYRVNKLKGGYKSFRQWVLKKVDETFPVVIVGGRTGSAKTETLDALRKMNEQIIDLEASANHKGSAFGDLGELPQPSQEQFENDLALKLFQVDKSESIWFEDESQRIGDNNIPNKLWEQMRSAKFFYLDVPFELRLQHVVNTYGKIPLNDLVAATVRIRKKLGGLQMKNVIDHLDKKNFTEAFRILLIYYDKAYDEATNKRKVETIKRIQATAIDPYENAKLILHAMKNEPR